MLSEISQRQIRYDITYLWNLKNNTNESYTKHKQTRKSRKKPHDYQSGEKGEEGQIRSMGLTDTNYYM